MSDMDENQPAPSPEGQEKAASSPPLGENLWAEMASAANYLTRFDLPISDSESKDPARSSVSWFPIVGALIGFTGACTDWVMTQIGLPGLLTSAFAIICMLWLTRALHEEEFANLVNQYSKKLEKDDGHEWAKKDRAIQHGTLAIISIIILKIGAIASIDMSEIVFSALIVAGALSRTAMTLIMASFPPVEGDAVADYFGGPSLPRIILGVFFASLITLFAFGGLSLALLLIAALFIVPLALLARSYIKGYNGALLGTTQEIIELVVLVTILALQ